MPRSILALALLFTVSGASHFLFHDFFAGIIPDWIPYHDEIVVVSGVLELMGAVGLLLPATRELAGWCLIALLVAVFPANVQMLLRARAMDAAPLAESLLWLRLPLQALLILLLYRYATNPSRRARLQAVGYREAQAKR